jgi:DNA-binding response OmpR family regulator
MPLRTALMPRIFDMDDNARLPLGLCRKHEADPKQQRYLQAVRGEGYMLVPE